MEAAGRWINKTTELFNRQNLKSHIIRLIRSRLFHFFSFGTVLLLIVPAPDNDHTITIKAAELRVFESRKMKELAAGQLTDAQKAEVLISAVEEELFYREGLRLGLDNNNATIKIIVIDRLKSLIKIYTGGEDSPTEEQLRKYYSENLSRYRKNGRTMSFKRTELLVRTHFLTDKRESAKRKFLQKVYANYKINVEGYSPRQLSSVLGLQVN